MPNRCLTLLTLLAACGGGTDPDDPGSTVDGGRTPDADEDRPQVDTCGRFEKHLNTGSVVLSGCPFGGGADAITAGLAKSLRLDIQQNNTDFEVTRVTVSKGRTPGDEGRMIAEVKNRGLVTRCGYNEGITLNDAEGGWLATIENAGVSGSYDGTQYTYCLQPGERGWTFAGHGHDLTDKFADLDTAVVEPWFLVDPEGPIPARALTVDGYDVNGNELRLLIRNQADVDLELQGASVIFLDAMERPIEYVGLNVNTSIPKGMTLDRTYDVIASYPARVNKIVVVLYPDRS